MPYQSRWKVDIPSCSLPTFLFGEPGTEVSLPDKRFLSEADRPDTHYLTRAQYKLWAQRFATGLTRSKEFKKGDRILLFASNDLFVPVVFMGTLLAGGIFSGANPTYTARELAHQLRDSGATYLLCSDKTVETGIEAAKLANVSQDRVHVYNSAVYDGPNAEGTQSLKGCKYWGDLVASAEESKDFAWDNLTGPGESNKTLALNYSSGTTGVPKGVEITHLNYVSNTLQVHQLATLHSDWRERQERARWLCFLPMYHAYGQTYFIANSFYRAIPVYIMPKFDFVQLLEHIQKFKITSLTLVPPIAVALAKHPAVKNYDLSSVQEMGCGAAPLGRDVSQQVENIMKGRVNMKQGWGMTEYV